MNNGLSAIQEQLAAFKEAQQQNILQRYEAIKNAALENMKPTPAPKTLPEAKGRHFRKLEEE